MLKTPAALRNCFERWDAAGRPTAIASSWTPSRWVRREVPVPAALEAAPVDRDVATKWAARVTGSDRDSQRDAFVVAMIWGHGPVPYGPFRTQRLMTQPGFDDALAEVTQVTLESGGVEAFRHVWTSRYGAHGNPAYLKFLGPAFGTKYIYFLTRALQARGEGRVTPVLDEVVRRWFALNAPDVDVAIGAQWQYASRYERFVDTTHEWGEELGIEADIVEQLIFEQQQADDGGSWATAWTKAPAPMETEQLFMALGQRLSELGVGDEAEGPLAQLEGLIDQATPQEG